MEFIIGAIIEILGTIKSQLNCRCGFYNNIRSLRDEAEILRDNIDELQMRVDDAKNNARVIYPQVERWLERAIHSAYIINEIENDFLKVQEGCLNPISRYSLSRKVKKTIEALRELHNNCNFDRISQDVPPASMRSLALRPQEEFESRKKIEHDVMEALRDNNVNMIGLWGMGGIGKTTMAEKIIDRVREEQLFDRALMVVASQLVNLSKIQQSIADQLGLTLDAEDLATRSYKIRNRLTDTKRDLIVVDDVWHFLKLEDLGIPSGNTFGGRCKILLTSRVRSVLNVMETQRIYRIEPLSEREAWLFFREKTGNCVDREDLHSIAEDVAKECKDLPVALMTVGGALRNQTSRQIWEDALVQLRSSNPESLPGVVTIVYGSLNLSYDYLQDNYARSLFLLCSVFEEDVDITLDILTWFGMGLNMLQRLGNLNETRNRTHTLIDVLKNHSLLLDGSDEHCVKMHDVFRHAALYNASKQELRGSVINLDRPIQENYYEDCFWISMTNLSNKTEFSMELKCPSLRLLMMKSENKQLYNDEMRLPNRFFDGMQEIRVLFMEEIHIRSLPPTTQLLKNLRTLYLFNCRVLESINIVGELLKLEILSCIGCYNIRALPREIGRLNRLMLLEIIRCRNLKRIVPGVISNLINLEELKIKYSFNGWEAEENIGKENAALVEIESLTKLTCLEIEINNVSLIAEEIYLPSGIVKHGISLIMKERDSYFFMQERDSSWDGYFSKMCLEIPRQMNVGNWIKTLVRSTEFLDLKGDGANQVNLVKLDQKLKSLTLRSCSLVKKLVNTTGTRSSVFPSLESLTLAYLDNLEEIIPLKSYIHSCFKNLRTISIEDCPRLRYLFPMSVAIRFLTQLQDLTVVDCEAMEDMIIFSDDDDKMEEDGGISSHNLHIALPKLSCLKLAGLPRLLLPQETLSKIVAPDNLRILHLERLMDDAISSVWCLFSSFSNLERIEIFYFNGIKNLMSPSIAGNLVHLKTLGIHSCKTMLEVIADDGDDEEIQVMGYVSLFPHLKELDLVCLPKLKSFSQRKYHYATLELPSLRDVAIDDCPQMETFIWGSLSTPKLEHIQMDLRTIKIKDLNEAVQRNFKWWESTSKLRTQKREKQEGMNSEENAKEEK